MTNADTSLLSQKRILIVEDEISIREPLGDYLTSHDLQIIEAENAQSARKHLEIETIHLVILDIMMPGEDGLSLCRFIREHYNIPIIFLTARSEDIDRIVGLELGADDYLVKPFNPRELLARIHAVLRRAFESPLVMNEGKSKNYQFGAWVLKADERILVDKQGVEIGLSSGEYALLLVMVTRPRMVLNREQLLTLSRGREADNFDRSIDNMISRLRRKIEEDPKNPTFIKTVWGGGYSFQSDVRAL